MNDDRSRDLVPAPSPAEAEAARERWYDRLLHRFNLKSRDTIRGDLEDALAEVGQDQSFSPQERAMLRNVLGLHRIRVDDVMVPRADIVAVAADTALGDLLGIFRTAGHSRLPVYGETLDDPRGMVHIRDFLDYLSARAEAGTRRRRRKAQGGEAAGPSLGKIDLTTTLASARILRPVLFVPPSMPAIDLLVRMQATRTHMALIIDEYGGTDGLVSIEDLVEMVVGDIEDEHDVDAAILIAPGEDDTFVADARIGLEEASEAIGIDLTAGEMAEEIDTLGGLIVTIAGRVPVRGELIEGPDGLEFEVIDADPRRVKRLRIYGAAKDDADGEAASPPSGAPAEPFAEPLALPPPSPLPTDRENPAA